MAAVGGFGAVTAFLKSFELTLSHEFDDPTAAMALALVTKLAADAPGTIGLAAGDELGFDLVGESFIVLMTRALGLGRMVGVTAAADGEGLAASGDGVGGCCGLLRLHRGGDGRWRSSRRGWWLLAKDAQSLF